jgi:hypothetical protein
LIGNSKNFAGPTTLLTTGLSDQNVRAWDEANEAYTGRLAADEAVFAHRNWTGRGSYQASFVAVQEGGWRIGSVATGAELSRMRSPEHDCVMLERVLVAIVLGEPAVELWAGLRALA